MVAPNDTGGRAVGAQPSGPLPSGKIPVKCGCKFAFQNGFKSCERVNELMHTKKEKADRKSAKKIASQKKVHAVKKAAAMQKMVHKNANAKIKNDVRLQPTKC